MIDNVVPVTRETMLAEVQHLADGGQRLISATAIDQGEYLEILYHFDKDLKLTHLKLEAKPGEEVPSISRIYFCAFVPENEIKDLFGVNITNIIIDYQGKFFLEDDAPRAPLLKSKPPEEGDPQEVAK